MINPIAPKRKLAAATDHGELNFVLTTTPPPPQKDSDDALVHPHGKRVHR